MSPIADSFTPLSGFLGGSIIGLSASVLLLCNGDILGASGITSSTILHPHKALSDPRSYWKLAFLLSFVLITHLFLAADISEKDELQKPPMLSLAAYIIGGLLTGFGTKLGNGCTTGHGICGMGRLSKRSFVAVGSFMATAFSTVAIIEASSSLREFLRTDKSPSFESTIGAVLSAVFVLLVLAQPFFESNEKGKEQCNECSSTQHHELTDSSDASEEDLGNKRNSEEQEDIEKPNTAETARPHEETVNHWTNGRRKLLPAAIAGSLFAIGLWFSGMILPSKVLGFLDLSGLADGSFDPTLVMVLAGACIVSWVSYQFVRGHNFIQHELQYFESPYALDSGKFAIPTNTQIDAPLLLGSALFGIGWATTGMCPGPALVHIASGNAEVCYAWLPTFLFGSFLAEHIKPYLSSD